MMEFKYTLPKEWVDFSVNNLEEFANGGAQVTIKTNDGLVHSKVLISNCMYIIAMRGHKDLPFDVNDIEDIYQTEEDKNPKERGGWDFWDNWETK